MLSSSGKLLMRLALLSPVASLLLPVANSIAAPANVHGFLSYSVVETGEVKYLSEEPDTVSHLLEGGLAGSYSFNDELRTSVQVIYRDFGDRYDSGLHLDYALLDWSLYGDLNTQLNAQIGRFKNVRGLYNATRDVPFTRPSILLPQGIYQDVFRDPLVSTDGLRLSGNHLAEAGQFGVDMGLGKTQAPDDFDKNLLGPSASGSFSSDYHYYLDLRYEPNERWLLAANFSDRKFHFSANSESSEPYSENLDFDYKALVLSLQYSRQYWEFVSEYSRSWIQFAPDNPTLPTDKANPISWYTQLRFFLPQDWVALVRYDYYDADADYGLADELEKYGETSDYTAGLTWNVTSDWMLRMEYHYMEGFAIIPPLSEQYDGEAPDHWHIFAAQVAYRF